MFIVVLFLSLLLLTGPGLFLLKRAILGMPRAGRRCYECGYDVECIGVSGRCPECGSPRVAFGVRPRIPRKQRLFTLLGAIVLLQPLVYGTLLVMGTAAQLPVMGRWFPRWTLSSASSSDSAKENAISTVLHRFSAGGVSNSAMRDAVRSAVQMLSRESKGLFPPLLGSMDRDNGTGMRVNVSNLAVTALTAALDNRSLNPDRRGALIDALAEAYETFPVENSSQIDDAIYALLTATLPKPWSSGSSDYAWPDGPPNATHEQRSRLIKMVLTVQANADRRWNPHWGSALELAYQAGWVTEEQFTLYLKQSLAPRMFLHEGDKARPGDVVVFDVLPRWRSGLGVPAFVRVRGTGVAEDRVIGPATIGTLTYANSSSTLHQAFAALPDQKGEIELPLTVSASFGPDVVDAMMERTNPSGPGNHVPVGREYPACEARKSVVLRLKLELPAAPVTRLTEDAGIASSMRDTLGARIRYNSGGGEPLVALSIDARQVPMDLAGDAFLVQGEREFPMGWQFAFRIRPQMSFVARLPDLDTGQPVSVVWRPRLGVVERPFWAPTVWGGELRWDNVLVSKSRLPHAMGSGRIDE